MITDHFKLLKKTKEHEKASPMCIQEKSSLLESILNSGEYYNLPAGELLSWIRKQIPDDYTADSNREIRRQFYSKVLSEDMTNADAGKYTQGDKHVLEQAVSALEQEFNELFDKGWLYGNMKKLIPKIQAYRERLAAVTGAIIRVDDFNYAQPDKKIVALTGILYRNDPWSLKMREAVTNMSRSAYKQARQQRNFAVAHFFNELKSSAQCADAKILYNIKDRRS